MAVKIQTIELRRSKIGMAMTLVLTVSGREDLGNSQQDQYARRRGETDKSFRKEYTWNETRLPATLREKRHGTAPPFTSAAMNELENIVTQNNLPFPKMVDRVKHEIAIAIEEKKDWHQATIYPNR